MTPMPREGKSAPNPLLRPAPSDALCSANSSSVSVAGPGGFQNAGPPRPAAAVAVWPIPAACAPTGNTRNSAPALRGGSCASRRLGGSTGRSTMAIGSTQPPNRSTAQPSKTFRLIDQHDGDVVFDRVDEAASGARQRLRGRSWSMLEQGLA